MIKQSLLVAWISCFWMFKRWQSRRFKDWIAKHAQLRWFGLQHCLFFLYSFGWSIGIFMIHLWTVGLVIFSWNKSISAFILNRNKIKTSLCATSTLMWPLYSDQLSETAKVLMDLTLLERHENLSFLVLHWQAHWSITGLFLFNLGWVQSVRSFINLAMLRVRHWLLN